MSAKHNKPVHHDKFYSSSTMKIEERENANLPKSRALDPVTHFVGGVEIRIQEVLPSFRH